MENNSKSTLKIRQVIASTMVFMILGSQIQLFISTKEKETKKQSIQENIVQEEIAQYYERNIETTARSESERESEIEVTYKTIDEITDRKSVV